MDEEKKLPNYPSSADVKKHFVKEIDQLLDDIDKIKKGKINFFTKIVGKKIIDAADKEMGTVHDLIISSIDKAPEVIAVVFKEGKNMKKIPFKNVNRIKENIYLLTKTEETEIRNAEENDILVGKSLLDKQLVDTDGLKVVRVNDIAFSKIDNRFIIVSIDVGMKGIFRRLGMSKLGKLMNVKEKLLPWDYVEPLEIELGKIKLTIPRKKLSALPPMEIADVIEELSPRDRGMVFNMLDNKTAAETLEELSPDIQKNIIENLRNQKVAAILEQMDADKSADILNTVTKERSERLLNLMKKDVALGVENLLSYDHETAGGIMTPNFVSIFSNHTAQETIDYLRKISPSAKHAYYLYVINDIKKLVGVLSLRNLIVAPPEKKVYEIMSRRVVSIYVNASKEDIAKTISAYNLLAIPVVNTEGQLQGVITVDDVLDVVIPRSWKRRPLHRNVTK